MNKMFNRYEQWAKESSYPTLTIKLEYVGVLSARNQLKTEVVLLCSAKLLFERLNVTTQKKIAIPERINRFLSKPGNGFRVTRGHIRDFW